MLSSVNYPNHHQCDCMTDKPMSKIDSAFTSGEQAILDMRLKHLNARLGEIKAPGDWLEVRGGVDASQSMSGEERSAAEHVVGTLQRLSQLSDKTSVLKRAAKHLVDVAIGTQQFKSLGQGEGMARVASAAEGLYEAAALYASEKDKSEAAVATGGMTDEEMEAARERMKQMKIT